MSERVLSVAWTATGHKPHLPDSDREGLSVCGRLIGVPLRRKVHLSDTDPVGGVCAKCFPVSSSRDTPEKGGAE